MSEELKTRPDHVLEDPGAQAVASLYARSFLEAAKGAEAVDAVGEIDSFEIFCRRETVYPSHVADTT